MPYWFYVVLVVSFFVVAAFAILFLWNEMNKKFWFMSKFVKSTRNQLVTYDYGGGFNRMVQLRLEWDRPFTVLVGFELNRGGLKGYDYYGYVESRNENSRHIVVIETYFGGGAAQFQFLINQPYTEENKPRLDMSETGSQTPSAFYPPHWFQSLLGL
jgi:hypothetical protein